MSTTDQLHGALTLDITGEAVSFLPHRAAYWHAARTLLVADLHLGKPETHHALGVGVPEGVMDEKLARFGQAAAASGAARIVVLGDLLHAAAGTTNAMISRFTAWRSKVDAEIVVVLGNHDRRLERLAAAWQLEIAGARLDDGPFTFVHDPRPIRGRFVWGGHLHPAVRLRAGGDSLKLPCFHLRTNLCVLPAFSAFTEGGSVPRGRGDRLFAVADDHVVEV